ncbi:Crp/Fnr family transcriptional regulator [Cellulophaga baltica]|uniref:Crp/Fnr family transcriptional regulator n=1 Tax=Cellulophaga TaxID=104264 RepID=UPI001C07B432|nr:MULTISPECIES: Crp/Fnr family transcriptional regulator [Cellulophaga]MBU2996280.1 Crp/Fnr family transcriptional regulator [Cellulophaga baltica]MDO6767675.1 Crp/Fnr family transcriptional regulator [Cellulophaga sp. 1_MG-2023]
MIKDFKSLNIYTYIKSYITISDEEIELYLNQCYLKTYKNRELISEVNVLDPNIYFIEKGFIRLYITDEKGRKHTTHFASENSFVSDYTSIIRQKASKYNFQALTETQVVVVPPEALFWLYKNVKEGEKFGRLVLDEHFIHLEERLLNLYTHSPQERFELMNSIFPDIHNLVPQHMIASYINVSPVHMSRLKKKNS